VFQRPGIVPEVNLSAFGVIPCSHEAKVPGSIPTRLAVRFTEQPSSRLLPRCARRASLAEDNAVVPEKLYNLGPTRDERICPAFSHSRSMESLTRTRSPACFRVNLNPALPNVVTDSCWRGKYRFWLQAVKASGARWQKGNASMSPALRRKLDSNRNLLRAANMTL
jgi:hypothetical protein